MNVDAGQLFASEEGSSQIQYQNENVFICAANVEELQKNNNQAQPMIPIHIFKGSINTINLHY